MAISKILVPLDKSNLDYKVLSTALSLADRYDAEVIVLRIRKEAAHLDMELQDKTRHDLDAIENETRAAVAEAFKTLREGHTVRPERIRAEVRAGAVAEAVVQAAEDLMVDLIVMGTHGRHGLAEVFTGSTTEQVVAKTPVSVLVIKPSGFPYLRD